jgi:hypothetical protein
MLAAGCGSEDTPPVTLTGGSGGADAAGDAGAGVTGPDTGAPGDSSPDVTAGAGGTGGVGGTGGTGGTGGQGGVGGTGGVPESGADAPEDSPADQGIDVTDAGETPVDATPTDGAVSDASDAADVTTVDSPILDGPDASDGSASISHGNPFASVSGAVIGQSTSYRIRMAAGGPQPRGSGKSTSYRLKIGL